VSPESGEIPIRILNPRTEPIELCKGKTIAVMEPIVQDQLPETVSSVGEKPKVSDKKQSQLWQMVSENGATLTEDERQQLYAVLVEYADIFAEEPDDFGRTDKIKHSANHYRYHTEIDTS